MKDAVIPGLYAYEAGQAAVGDLFSYSEQLAPKHIVDQALERKFQYLNF